MAHILVVEDDEFLRMALRTALESTGHSADEASDGLHAKQLLETGSQFDVVLTDIQMPNMSGVDLLTWIKANKPLPVILMTGFAEVMEASKAQEIGADEFIAKPFKNEDLLRAILNLTTPKSEKTEANSTVLSDYCKISINEFVSTKSLQFDVYVLLGSRYVKIGHKGDIIPGDRIQSYKQRGLKYLHTLREDFRKVVLFNVHLSKQVKSSALPPEKKAHFMRYTAETIMERAYISGVDEENFEVAKDFVTSTMDVLSAEDEAFVLLTALNSHSDYLYGHSLFVATYSVMIARRCGIESSQTMYKLAMCGIYHNIGMKEIDRDLLKKSRAAMTADERKTLESHTQRGGDILMSLKTIPSDVQQVAYQHHENESGTGYPRGLRRPQIHPLVRFVQAADVFGELVLKQPDGTAGLSPKQALVQVALGQSGNLDRDCIAALTGIFQKAI